jgi:hypothetical protein
MLAAIYSGLMEEATVHPLAPLCSTGNCTFPTFKSLGFCSECCDVTAETIRTCDTTGNVLTCNYTLPSNIMVQSNNSLPHQLRKIFPWPANSPISSGSCNMKALENSVASFGALDLAPTPEIPVQQAALCALFPCIQTHNISVTAGRPSASVLTTWRNSGSNTYVGGTALSGSYVMISDAETPVIPSEVLEIRNILPKLSARSGTLENLTEVTTALAPTSLSLLTIQSLPTRIINTPSTSLPPTGFPSSLPKVISPLGGIPPQPANHTMISLGFNYGFNYTFIVQNQTSIEQIFSFIVSPISRALNLEMDELIPNSIHPRNTIAEVGFITTLAYIFIPTSSLSTLRLLLLAKDCRLFQDPSPLAQTLMVSIDFSISEVPTQNLGTDTTPADLNEPSSFQLSQNRFFALNAWFAQAFDGTVEQSDDPLRGRLWSRDQVTASSDLLLAMYHNGHNISTSMDNLAISMSNHIRNTGGSSTLTSSNNTSTTAKGTGLGMETYVHVRWAWLTLPVACVVSTLFFLISVILQTRRQGTLVWKSSVLAYLFHGLDRTSVRETSAEQVTEMTGAAAQVKVRLERDGDAIWKLLRVGRRVEGVDDSR